MDKQGGATRLETDPLDLQGGKISEAAEVVDRSLLDLYAQRKTHRTVLFYASLVFCTAMTLAFLWFVLRMVCLFAQASWFEFDWHILLLGSGLIVPPTIILFSLTRRVYDPDTQSSGGAELPSQEAVSSASGLLQSITDLVKGLTTPR